MKSNKFLEQQRSEEESNCREEERGAEKIRREHESKMQDRLMGMMMMVFNSSHKVSSPETRQ